MMMILLFMSLLKFIYVAVVLSFSVANAAPFLTDFSQLPTDIFDFIIVGGTCY